MGHADHVAQLLADRAHTRTPWRVALPVVLERVDPMAAEQLPAHAFDPTRPVEPLFDLPAPEARQAENPGSEQRVGVRMQIRRRRRQGSHLATLRRSPTRMQEAFLVITSARRDNPRSQALLERRRPPKPRLWGARKPFVPASLPVSKTVGRRFKPCRPCCSRRAPHCWAERKRDGVGCGSHPV